MTVAPFPCQVQLSMLVSCKVGSYLDQFQDARWAFFADHINSPAIVEEAARYNSIVYMGGNRVQSI